MAAIHCKKRSFVIGSHGIANVSRGEALGSWFQIAHDVALAPTLNNFVTPPFDAAQVEAINRFIALRQERGGALMT